MVSALGDNVIPLAAIVLTFLFFAIWIVAATIDSVYKTNCNLRLKERLVAKGMSAEEISRIVNAGTAADPQTVAAHANERVASMTGRVQPNGWPTPSPPVK